MSLDSRPGQAKIDLHYGHEPSCQGLSRIFHGGVICFQFADTKEPRGPSRSTPDENVPRLK